MTLRIQSELFEPLIHHTIAGERELIGNDSIPVNSTLLRWVPNDSIDVIGFRYVSEISS